MLSTFRAQDEGELRTGYVLEQLSHRTRRGRSPRIELLVGQAATGVKQTEVRPPVIAKAVSESLAHEELAPELALSHSGVAMTTDREREREFDGLLGRRREVQGRGPGLVEVLSLVRDLADPIGPPAGTLKDDRRFVFVRDRQLVERADAARDHDHGIGRAHSKCVPHPAHPRRDRDVHELVRVALLEARQDPDDDAAGALRTAAHRLHDPGEATRHDDALALGDQTSDLLGHAERFLGNGVARILRALTDDRDENRAGHGAVSIGSRSRSARSAAGHANQWREATAPLVSSYASGSMPSQVSIWVRRFFARCSRDTSFITRASTTSCRSPSGQGCGVCTEPSPANVPAKYPSLAMVHPNSMVARHRGSSAEQNSHPGANTVGKSFASW